MRGLPAGNGDSDDFDGSLFALAGGPADMAVFRCSPVTLRRRLSTGMLLAALCLGPGIVSRAAPLNYEEISAVTVSLKCEIGASAGLVPQLTAT